MSDGPAQTESMLEQAVVRLDMEKPYVEAIRKHPLMLNLREIGLTQEAWKRYGIERYLSAQPFIPLLEAAHAHASSTISDDQLAQVLARNLADERGETSPELGSHEKWRQDFYTALGISETELDTAVLSEESAEYAAALQVAAKDPFHAIGAIHFLEVTIPFEFYAILQSCESTFPDKFKLETGEPQEVRRGKENARRYLEDHIVHDMKEHFFDLKRALALHLSTQEPRQRILEGMDLVKNAKIPHMSALNEEFFVI